MAKSETANGKSKLSKESLGFRRDGMESNYGGNNLFIPFPSVINAMADLIIGIFEGHRNATVLGVHSSLS